MIYEDIHIRYGAHIASRVQVELSASEFRQIEIEELPSYLEMRAEAAHKEYQTRLENPFVNEELGDARKHYVDVLCRRWREAEDLAYLIGVAEDVSTTTRRAMGA